MNPKEFFRELKNWENFLSEEETDEEDLWEGMHEWEIHRAMAEAAEENRRNITPAETNRRYAELEASLRDDPGYDSDLDPGPSREPVVRPINNDEQFGERMNPSSDEEEDDEEEDWNNEEEDWNNEEENWDIEENQECEEEPEEGQGADGLLNAHEPEEGQRTIGLPIVNGWPNGYEPEEDWNDCDDESPLEYIRMRSRERRRWRR